MKTNLKTIAIATAVIATVATAGAQEPGRGRAQQTGPQQCPTCGKLQARGNGQVRTPQHTATELRRQRQIQAERIAPQQQMRQRARQQALRQQQVRRPFDINRDGQISPAEREARKAYRAMIQEQRAEHRAAAPRPRQPITE